MAIRLLINSIALFLDSSSGAATVTSPVSFTSTLAPEVSTISLIVAPPFPITVAISFLSIVSDASLLPGAVGKFDLYVPQDFGAFIGYSYIIDWEEYK
mgnify:CR=1 FL=1